MTWYVIQTIPNAERKAASDLRANGLRVYLPKQFSKIVRRKTVSMRARPLLTGYLLVRFPAEDVATAARLFAIAHASEGVRDIIWYRTETGWKVPYPIPDKDVRSFIRRQRRREFGRPAIETEQTRRDRLRQTYAAGTKVRVKDGPFRSFHGITDRLNDAGALEVLVELLGRETRITFSLPDEQLDVSEEAA